MSRRWSIVKHVAIGVGMLSALCAFPANAQDSVGRRFTRVEQPNTPAAGDCTSEGGCNWWQIRDIWSPGESAKPLTLKVRFNLFHPGYSDEDPRLAEQMAIIANDFAKHGIHVAAAESQTYSDTSFAIIDSEKELEAMKNTYANKPTSQLNIYVVRQMDTKADRDGEYRGARSYPWTSKAAANQAGIVIDGDYVGQGRRLLTHEIGRCLGLSHLFTDRGATRSVAGSNPKPIE